MATKRHQRRRQTNVTNRIGLLWAPIKTYESLIWDAAYEAAVTVGQRHEAAVQIADDALKVAKKMKEEAIHATNPNP